VKRVIVPRRTVPLACRAVWARAKVNSDRSSLPQCWQLARYIRVIVKLPDPLQPDITPLIVQVPETVFMLLIEP
jgi:hypothetical protein